jgi:hypothetical protein
MAFFLDHVIIPGDQDGDHWYETEDSIPCSGEGIQGYYESEPYLLRVVGMAMYPGTKSIGALLLVPVAPINHLPPDIKG